MNQIRPEVALLLAEKAALYGITKPVLHTNPIWYWLDYNAEHGAEKRIIEWMLRDAERYEEMAR